MSKIKYIILVDIDGTIADCSERAKKYITDLETPNWDAFYEACSEDKPIPSIIQLVEELSTYYDIIFCSGRRESVKEKTIAWMKKYLVNTQYEPLHMLFRKDGDTRHDTEVKPELLDALLKEHPEYNICYILEDRNSMVAKWRELGYTCLQVADGNF